MVYVIAGIICGLAGVMWASRFEAAQTNTALGFELQTVAASVIGGVSMLGGIGTVPGVLLGALLLGVIQNGLTLSGISPFWQLAVQGFLILLAVVSDSAIQQRVRANCHARCCEMTTSDKAVSILDQPRSASHGLSVHASALGMVPGGFDRAGRDRQQPVVALLPERREPVPGLVGLHRDGPDDAADGLDHRHRQRRSGGRFDAGHDGFVHGAAVQQWREHLDRRRGCAGAGALAPAC